MVKEKYLEFRAKKEARIKKMLEELHSKEPDRTHVKENDRRIMAFFKQQRYLKMKTSRT